MSLYVVTVGVTAGNQFTTSSVDLSAAREHFGRSFVKVVEVDLLMGTEAKTWSVSKTLISGDPIVLAQSLSGSAAGPSTDSTVFINEGSLGCYLTMDEGIDIVTTSATSAMEARIWLQEV